MTQHLNDREIDQLLAGDELAPFRCDHMENCLSCRAKIEEFRNAVESLRLLQEEEMPDWENQHYNILQRLDTLRGETLNGETLNPKVRHISGNGWKKNLRRSLLMAAAVLLLFMGGIHLRSRSQLPLMTTPIPELQIEDILQTADALLADTAIPGFESLDTLDNSTIQLILEEDRS